MKIRGNKYYHLTTEENAAKILVEGLKPVVGDRSKAIHDERTGIFLCKRKCIAYWQIILNLQEVLEVTGIDAEKSYSYNYGDYEEFIYEKEIPASNIKRTNIKPGKIRAMRRLCISYISTISRFCELCARYYDAKSKYGKELYEDLDAWADTLLYVLPNLNYKLCSKSKIVSEIEYAGQELCAYTLCDKYYDTGKRLYQMLLEYPADELTEKRNKIHNLIKMNLDGCLEVDTGGWCGC